MKLSRTFRRSVFPAECIEELAVAFRALPHEIDEWTTESATRQVGDRSSSWNFDTDDEFLSEYRRHDRPQEVSYYLSNGSAENQRTLSVSTGLGLITIVSLTSPNRAEIERLNLIVDRYVASSRIAAPDPDPPVIFIGHGGSTQWRDLRDHLQDKHGLRIEAYEIGERAGHTIRDVLESMVKKSSLALLVMTGEDAQADGSVRARQNVVHEAGLFQGALGFNRAIVLVEEETDVFSNLQGIQQIRYSSNNIKETFGDVLAVLRREFGE